MSQEPCCQTKACCGKKEPVPCCSKKRPAEETKPCCQPQKKPCCQQKMPCCEQEKKPCCQQEKKPCCQEKKPCCQPQKKPCCQEKKPCCQQEKKPCCQGGDQADERRGKVSSNYGQIARETMSLEDEKRQAGFDRLAAKFGYDPKELAALPKGANQGLSCGNPVAQASIRPGETVLDLGAGGGMDVFIASQKVGETGKVIGLDMTQDMVDLATRNAKADGITNVEFVLGLIEDMPLKSGIVDCVISNCVINLVPDKAKAFREIVRVLKPGGRFAVSDIVLKKPLPTDLPPNVHDALYNCCIGGAVPEKKYVQWLKEAGFKDVSVLAKNVDLNMWKNPECKCLTKKKCCESEAKEEELPDVGKTMEKYDFNEFAASVYILASK